jgi:hypothetical protein
MCGKGEYTSLTPSLDEDRLVDSMASLKPVKIMMKGSQSDIEVNIMASIRNSSHSNKLKMAKQQKEFC